MQNGSEGPLVTVSVCVSIGIDNKRWLGLAVTVRWEKAVAAFKGRAILRLLSLLPTTYEPFFGSGFCLFGWWVRRFFLLFVTF